MVQNNLNKYTRLGGFTTLVCKITEFITSLVMVLNCSRCMIPQFIGSCLLAVENYFLSLIGSLCRTLLLPINFINWAVFLPLKRVATFFQEWEKNRSETNRHLFFVEVLGPYMPEWLYEDLRREFQAEAYNKPSSFRDSRSRESISDLIIGSDKSRALDSVSICSQINDDLQSIRDETYSDSNELPSDFMQPSTPPSPTCEVLDPECWVSRYYLLRGQSTEEIDEYWDQVFNEAEIFRKDPEPEPIRTCPMIGPGSSRVKMSLRERARERLNGSAQEQRTMMTCRSFGVCPHLQRVVSADYVHSLGSGTT